MAGCLTWWAQFFTQVAVNPRDLPLLGVAFMRRTQRRRPAETWALDRMLIGADQLYRAARHQPNFRTPYGRRVGAGRFGHDDA